MSNRMFSIILGVFFAILVLCACTGAGSDASGINGEPQRESQFDYREQYAMNPDEIGAVYTLNASAVTENGEVFFASEDGNMWVCEIADGEPAINQHVILVLWDNGTPDFLTDDVILEWRQA